MRSVPNAWVHLAGAALQANCPGGKWGGVWLAGNGVAHIEQSAMGVRSRIFDAQTGLNSRAGNQYYISNTDFEGDDTGVYELTDNKTAQTGEGVQNCTFHNGVYGLVLEGGDYQPYSVVGGDYSAASFTQNTFADITWMGVYATAGNAHIANNTFRNCGWAAMATWNAPQAGRTEFVGNQISVPATGIAPMQMGSTSFGAAGIFSADQTLLVTNNTIVGAPAPLSTIGTQRVGIHYLYKMESGSYDQVTGNSVSNLDQAFTTVTNDYDGAQITVKKNTFTNNAADMVLYPWGSYNYGATVSATIRCNSFINDGNSTVSQPIGIWLKSLAVINTGLNGPIGNGNEFPAAQWGPGIGTSIVNSSSSSLQYKRLSTNKETITTAGSVQVFPDNITTPNGACGGTSPGVNSRQYTIPLISATAIMDSLRANNLTTIQQVRLLTELRSQPLQQSQLPVIEELLTATHLASTSRLAIGLYLFTYYHEQHDLANITRLRNWLNDSQLNDKGELAAYLQLTQALDQMGSFLPGFRPLADTNRGLLQQVATSGTTSAWLACQLLRAYEPTCSCVLPTEDLSTYNARPAVTSTVSPHALLPAYPNPASTVLHVPYVLPAGTSKAELVAYDALGRVVLRQAVSGQQSEIEVSTQTWAAGLYQLTLVVGGRVLGTQRVAIISY